MRYYHWIYAALAGLMPVQASALTLQFPAAAEQTARETKPLASVSLPVGVLENGTVPMAAAEGALSRQAWRLQAGAASTLEILKPLRSQLENAGYSIVLECETQACGGYDFRYQVPVLPEPEMHVDLGDFRCLTARRTDSDGQPEYVSLIVSRGGRSAFVQMTTIGAAQNEDSLVVASTKSPDAATTANLPAQSIGAQLLARGRAPLEDLSFATGSATLKDDSFSSLAELASWLKANPQMKVALVGHTDAEGSLSGNIALSKKRAAAVMKRLVSAYGIPARQLEASGVGYLMPRASNLTNDGRQKNRRVEVILTSTR